MNEIFDMMDEEKKYSYDKEYIEEVYLKYMTAGKVQEEHKEELVKELKGKKVILVAPGKSSVEEKKKIIETAMNGNVIVVSVNFEYTYVRTDYIFLSNLRRFRELDINKRNKCIVTSNIPADGVYFRTRYKDLVNQFEPVKDNAGLMSIKFFMDYDVDEILLAGFDGYSHDVKENYADNHMAFIMKNAVLDAMNEGMKSVLKKYSDNVKISFLTEPKHVEF
jgi:4-hydroxy 2-oxovalerate aldolase